MAKQERERDDSDRKDDVQRPDLEGTRGMRDPQKSGMKRREDRDRNEDRGYTGEHGKEQPRKGRE